MAADSAEVYSENVWLVQGDMVLSIALESALRARGWQAVFRCTEASLPRAALAAHGRTRLVLVSGADGRLPDPRPALAGNSDLLVVAIAKRDAFSMLAELACSRVISAALDADQPFPALAAALEEALRPTCWLADPGRWAAALLSREDEALRFAQLTQREQQVLAALLDGDSAAEIAAKEFLAIPTVRSHLRAILTKLGVSSQLAAAAMAHRSCREATLLARMREVHQF